MAKAATIVINVEDGMRQRETGANGDSFALSRDKTTADLAHDRAPAAVNDFFQNILSVTVGGTTIYQVQRNFLGFDTSAITIPPESATFSFTTATATLTNVASDHKVIFAATKGGHLREGDVDATTSPLRSRARTGFGDGTTATTSLYDAIEGWAAGSSWANTIRPYTDPILATNLNTNGANISITLNKNACLDIARCDHFYMVFLDYTYEVLNVDPLTGSPSAGATSNVSLAFANNTFSSRGASYTIPKLSLVSGGREEQTPTKKRIDDKFTINGFSDITDQRKAYTREGNLLDQVPFQLGIKGPLSLRGRQNDEDGTPLTTAGPPKVTN